MKSVTIEGIIGGNLAKLRRSENLTVQQAVDVLRAVTGTSFSVPKLWRWEQGKYRFKLDDLFLMSQLYGVNVLSFLKPVDDTVTHVRTGCTDIPVDKYVMDYYIDPVGTFPRRAAALRGQTRHLSRAVEAAFADIENRLADKAGPGDYRTTAERIRGVAETIATTRDQAVSNPTEDNVFRLNHLRVVAKMALNRAHLEIDEEQRRELIEELIDEHSMDPGDTHQTHD